MYLHVTRTPSIFEFLYISPISALPYWSIYALPELYGEIVLHWQLYLQDEKIEN